MSEKLKQYLSRVIFRVDNWATFDRGLNMMLGAINSSWRQGLFLSDNLMTFGKNLSLLDDRMLMDAMARHAETDVEKGIIWRTAILVWAARNGLRREGDFVECGCYRGTSARIICDAVNFNASEKSFFLYDLFEYPKNPVPFPKFQHLSATLFDDVKQRFAAIPRAHVIKGSVPDSLVGTAPERIAFLHIDMNHVVPEIAALDMLFERVVPGGVVVLDDYGYIPYVAQRDAERDWFAARGYDIIELPTGQGLVIR